MISLQWWGLNKDTLFLKGGDILIFDYNYLPYDTFDKLIRKLYEKTLDSSEQSQE